MITLQNFITYTPGVNSVIFQMGPMDWFQWVIVVIFMVAVFVVMEVEKAVRRYLSELGEDTDDRNFDPTFDMDVERNTDEPFPRTHFYDQLHK
jgi:hypothetical protein